MVVFYKRQVIYLINITKILNVFSSIGIFYFLKKFILFKIVFVNDIFLFGVHHIKLPFSYTIFTFMMDQKIHKYEYKPNCDNFAL